MMRYFGLVVVAISMHLLGYQVGSAQACVDGRPFLGIGLGYNQYNVDQVLEIGNRDLCQLPLVYNWALGPSPQLADNLPHLDFPERFIPMTYGCSDFGVRKTQRELSSRTYSGPLLIFNEPDRQDQANCTPEQAAEAFHQIVLFRNQYERETGNRIQLIVGGVAEPSNGIPWMDGFLEAYQSAYGLHPLKDGIAEAVHFHLYPRFAYDNADQAFENIFEQFSQWAAWLDQNETTAWVTELGVLNAPFQPFPEDELHKLFSKSIPILLAHPKIEHAFVFTLNAESGTESENFTLSALIRDGVETEAYRYVKSICGNGNSEYCNPIPRTANQPAADQQPLTDPQEDAGQIESPDGRYDQAISSSGYLGQHGSQIPLPAVYPPYTRPNRFSYGTGYK